VLGCPSASPSHRFALPSASEVNLLNKGYAQGAYPYRSTGGGPRARAPTNWIEFVRHIMAFVFIASDK